MWPAFVLDAAVAGDTVTQVMADDLNDPEPPEMAEELGNLLIERDLHERRNEAHEQHRDDVRANVAIRQSKFT